LFDPDKTESNQFSDFTLSKNFFNKNAPALRVHNAEAIGGSPERIQAIQM